MAGQAATPLARQRERIALHGAFALATDWYNDIPQENNVTGFTPLSALAGGALLGAASVLLMKFNGRIAGISGILNGALSMEPGDRLWRWLFVVGLILGGYSYQQFTQVPLITRDAFPLVQLALAGILVGFGTRLGSGCTSGHGVCGIARLSPRSVISTLIFLAIGAVVATSLAAMTGRSL